MIDWELLLTRIKDGKCTPFLGAGACWPYLPLSNQIAQELTEKHNYPLPDIDNLPRVAQFLSIKHRDAIFPKERVIKILNRGEIPDFESHDTVHSILAELPFTIYLTTNYDDFMTEALKIKDKTVVTEYCRWNSVIANKPLNIDDSFIPTINNRLVYHLHGIWDVAESLVLTEDDYFDFLVNVSQNKDILPHQISNSLTGTTLLFIGYRLDDLSFRTLFRGLIYSPEKSLKRIKVSVQIPPIDVQRQTANCSIESLEKFINSLNIEQSSRKKLLDLVSTTKELVTFSKINKVKLYQNINAIETELITRMITDVSKKNLFISIINKLQESIGLLPSNGKPSDKQAIQFLKKYYQEMDIQIYWGTARQFAQKLLQKWRDFKRRNP